MEKILKRIENKLFTITNMFFNPMGYKLTTLNIYKGSKNESYLVFEFILDDVNSNILSFQFITEYHKWLDFTCDIFLINTTLNSLEIKIYLRKFMEKLVYDTELMKDMELYSILLYENILC